MNKVFLVLARISYAQYILQEPVATMLGYYITSQCQERRPCSPSNRVFLMVYPFVLLASAYLAQRLIERPYTDWQRKRTKDGVLGFDEQVMARIDTVLDRLCRCRCR